MLILDPLLVTTTRTYTEAVSRRFRCAIGLSPTMGPKLTFVYSFIALTGVRLPLTTVRAFSERIRNVATKSVAPAPPDPFQQVKIIRLHHVDLYQNCRYERTSGELDRGCDVPAVKKLKSTLRSSGLRDGLRFRTFKTSCLAIKLDTPGYKELSG